MSKNIDSAPMSTNVMRIYYGFRLVYSIFVIWKCWLNGKESILAMSGQHISKYVLDIFVLHSNARKE